MIPEGYKMQTTFINDFRIANAFGIGAIQDTYDRAFNEWKNNVDYMKEFVLALNWHCWREWEKKNTTISKFYSELYYTAHEYCLDHFKGKELEEYIDFID